jgi:Metallo-peptidase family M12B Reprolysin-like
MKHSLLTVTLVVAVALLVGCPSNPADNLTITSIEITQGIQDTTNSIALVSQRSTTVRVFLNTGSGNAITGVTGNLAVWVNGAIITPVGGISSVNQPITVPASPNRNNESDSLYFELPAPSGIPASGDVDFFVVVAGPGQLRNAEVLNKTFSDTVTPTVFFASVDYTPSGLGLPAAALIDPGVGDAFVKGIYPVNDADAVLYQSLFLNLGFSQDTNGDGLLNGTDDNDLLSGLASVRDLIVFLGANNNNTFVYGWLAGNPIPGNGLGSVGGFAAFGNTQESRHQRTFAHELGHNFGLSHNSRTLDQTGWDSSARLENNPAANNTTGRVKNTSKFDIMVGGKLTTNAWVDTTTYNFFSSSPVLAGAGPVPQSARLEPAMLGLSRLEASKGVLVVQGSFDPSGKTLQKVEPALRFPWLMEPSIERPTDRYLIEVKDDQGGAYQRTFNAQVGDDSEVEREEYGFFEVAIPVPVGRKVASVRIRDPRNVEQVYFSATGSEPPSITVLTPQPGASLGERTEVSWRVDDPDTKPAAMQFQVAYSPDNGESWRPVAVDVPGEKTSVVINSKELRKSNGQGLIRVFVSDGLNTRFDDATGLSTPQAIR